MERVGPRPIVRRTVVALALVGSSVLVAACGSGVATPGVASLGTTTSTTTPGSNGGAGGGGSNYDTELAFSLCMRKHGVANFPDPSATGGLQITGINPRSSVFQAALKTCEKDVPGGGLPGGGAPTNPSPAAMAAMLKVSGCMQAHGITNFPDPTNHAPSLPPVGGGVISDRDGVILVLPNSLDMGSSLFRRAAKACHFPLTNH